MSVLDGVLADLSEEGDRLRAAVADLDGADWRTATPAEGWDVSAQIGHLAWTDEVATLAAQAHQGDAGKAAWDEVVLQAIADPDGFVDAEALRLAALASGELLSRWDAARIGLEQALRALPDGTKMPWFGPPMSAASMATARFMETWAHSLDVHEGLGLPVEPRDSVKHVAHLGVRTRNFAFGVHELTPPAEEFRVELTAPSGEAWTWGPAEATQRVSGQAYDFALLVTQRRHRDDVDLMANGAEAEKWLEIAQAFAGPAGGGRDRA